MILPILIESVEDSQLFRYINSYIKASDIA